MAESFSPRERRVASRPGDEHAAILLLAVVMSVIDAGVTVAGQELARDPATSRRCPQSVVTPASFAADPNRSSWSSWRSDRHML
jgi:hypothetical protein